MSYYDSIKDKICERGCGTRIIFKGKIRDKKNSTGWFEYDDTKQEHTYPRCDKMLKQLKIKQQHTHLFGLDGYR